VPERWGVAAALTRPRPARVLGLCLVLAVAAVVPFELDRPNLSICVLVAAAMVGAMGLNVLLGFTGQLSLAQPFFLAVGAVGYSFLATPSSGSGDTAVSGAGWPALLAAVAAVVVSGLLGVAFSPLAGRLRGMYLGIASLGLVFLAQHLLFNWHTVTGGFNGRLVPDFSFPGLRIADAHPPAYLLGVPFGRLERLWYLDVVVVIAAYLFARNAMRGRPGRALQAIRDSEVAASTLGVNLVRYRAYAFGLSSVYAGLAGVLLALANGAIVPETFGFTVAIDYLAMVVVGGLGSLLGACVGAIFVIALPLVLQNNIDNLPFVAKPGGSGIQASEWANIAYGVAIVAVLLFEERGLAGLAQRVAAPLLRRRVPHVEAAAPVAER
jgi:branched-chain amino acid transport system permease protein